MATLAIDSRFAHLRHGILRRTGRTNAESQGSTGGSCRPDSRPRLCEHAYSLPKKNKEMKKNPRPSKGGKSKWRGPRSALDTDREAEETGDLERFPGAKSAHLHRQPTLLFRQRSVDRRSGRRARLFRPNSRISNSIQTTTRNACDQDVSRALLQ